MVFTLESSLALAPDITTCTVTIRTGVSIPVAGIVVDVPLLLRVFTELCVWVTTSTSPLLSRIVVSLRGPPVIAGFYA